MGCLKRDYLNCPSQIMEKAHNCGCLLVDYLQKVDECNVDIKIIVHIARLAKQKGSINWLERNMVKLKRVFTLKIETVNPIKDKIALLALWLQVLAMKHQQISYIAGLFTLILLVIIGDFLLLGLFAFVALFIYTSYANMQ